MREGWGAKPVWSGLKWTTESSTVTSARNSLICYTSRKIHTLKTGISPSLPGKDHEQELTQQTLLSVPVWSSDTKLSPAPNTVSGKDHLVYSHEQMTSSEQLFYTSHRKFSWKEDLITAHSFTVTQIPLAWTHSKNTSTSGDPLIFRHFWTVRNILNFY